MSKQAPLVGLLMVLVASPVFGGGVRLPAKTDGPLRHAAARVGQQLEQWKVDSAREIVVLVDSQRGDLAPDGYLIDGGLGRDITITASSTPGAANGLYTLLRKSMQYSPHDPFRKAWSIKTTPGFKRRAMMVCPYPFGGQQGLPRLGTDTWSLEEWKDYVDFLRLLNATALQLNPMRMWHPDLHATQPEQWRFDIWKQVLDHCHQVGLEFHVVMTFNQVPPALYWAHPDLAVERHTTWHGVAFCFRKGRKEIAWAQAPMLRHFAAADAFVWMYNDAGAACFCERCMADPAGLVAEEMDDAANRVKAAGSKARNIFWAWGTETQVPVFGEQLPDLLTTYPHFKNFAVDLRAKVGKSYEYMDMSYPHFWPYVRVNPFVAARAAGFKTLTNFLWLMGPEEPNHMFPQPVFRFLIEEAERSVASSVEGMCGYRLAPAGRRVTDFAFLRLAEQPDLDHDVLVRETASYLARGNTAWIEPLAEGLRRLEGARDVPPTPGWLGQAWAQFQQIDREKADAELQDFLDLVELLVLIEPLRDPSVDESTMKNSFQMLVALVRRSPVLQGFSSDCAYGHEARKRLIHTLGDMVPHLRKLKTSF